MRNKLKYIFVMASILCLLLGTGVYANHFFGTDYDFGGKTVTFWHWSMDELAGRFREGEIGQGRIEEAEQLFNAKIDFQVIGYNSVAENYMARLLSGDSALDVWGVSQGIAYFDLIGEGAFLPMTNIVESEYYNTISAALRIELEMLSFRGEIYGIGPSTHSALYSPSIQLSAYNKDLFEREGLEDPYELYLAGEWTWEKVTELAKQLTKDTDGDGVIDQFGMRDIGGYTSPALMIANGGNVMKLDEDGNMVYTMDERAALEALQQIYEWDKIDGVMGGKDADFIAGKVGMSLFRSIHGFIPIKEQMEDRYGIVPNPRGPRMDKYTYPKFSMATFVLPANSQYPQGLVALANFLYRESDTNEDAYIDAFARDRNSASVLLDASSSWSGETMLVNANAITGIIDPAMSATKSGSKTPAVAAGEIRAAVQNVLDELFN